MLVVAKVTHFTDGLHVEGEEFEYDGPLYKYIDPVASDTEVKAPRHKGKQKSPEFPFAK